MNTKRLLCVLSLVVGILSVFAADAPKLLPFQGRLMDRNGAAAADGERVVQFKIYDAPVGGQAVWNGEVQKLTVNGGLVSTILGSKASLSSVDFNKSLYLEVTIDANNDNQITVADPPMLPRQAILPAVFAKEAAKLNGYDWSVLFGDSNPATGTLLDAKIRDGSVGTAKLQGSSINSDKLAQEVIDRLVPAGTIVAFGGSRPPPGWMLCDGTSISRETYSALYAAISNAWGTLDSGTFMVPDLRGMFLRGTSGGTDRDPDRFTRRSYTRNGNSETNVGSFQPAATSANGLSVTFPGGFLFDTGNDDGGYPLSFDTFRTGSHSSPSTRPTPFNSELIIRGAAETRPLNVYVNYIIKL